MSKWLEFKENSDKTIGVWNKKTGDFLGLLRYWRGWRQYVFSPKDSAFIFNDECLTSIAKKLKEMKK